MNQGECKINDQDPDGGNSALHAACSYGHTVLLCWLINEGGDVNIADEDGDTPLHVCEVTLPLTVLNLNSLRSRFLQSPECADVLKQAGANLSAPNNTGWTALDVALDDGERPQMVSWLQEQGVGKQEEMTEEAVQVWLAVCDCNQLYLKLSSPRCMCVLVLMCVRGRTW